MKEDDMYHVWTTYASGRPARLVGSYKTAEEAASVCGCGLSPEADRGYCRCVVVVDPYGDGTVVEDDGFLYFE